MPCKSASKKNTYGCRADETAELCLVKGICEKKTSSESRQGGALLLAAMVGLIGLNKAAVSKQSTNLALSSSGMASGESSLFASLGVTLRDFAEGRGVLRPAECPLAKPTLTRFSTPSG